MKLAIASGKGGTGKTTLSTNLAKYLSEENDVVLTDLDVEEPNSGLFIKGDLWKHENKFKMVPEWNSEKCNSRGTCQAVCKFNAILKLGDTVTIFPALCHSCYACSELCPNSALPMVPKKIGELKHFVNGSLHFIESRLNIGEEQSVPLISQTINYTDENYNSHTIKIFDSPPGTSCPVIEATKDSDFVILVTEPTPFGLHDLKLAVETMRELKKRFGVVINRFGIGNDDVINYCSEEGIEILAKIPNNRNIAELYSRGELLYDSIPQFKSELERIKNHILKLMNISAE